jgi:protocatechuate 3,4-dioxygenase beta subunit
MLKRNVAMAVVICFSLAGAVRAEMATVAGQVLAPDGKPAAACRVAALYHQYGHLVREEKTTDQGGHFSFSVQVEFPLQYVTVVALHAQYALDMAVLRDGEEATLRLGATPPTCTGQVTNSEGMPVAGAEVSVAGLYLLANHGEEGWTYWRHSFDLKGSGLFSAQTDAAGRFSFPGLPDKTFALLNCSAPGFPLGEERAQAVPKSEPVQIVLDTGGSLAGRVSLDGKPVSGARLAALVYRKDVKVPATTPVGAEATTSADGSYLFPHLAAGKYDVALVDGPGRCAAPPVPGVTVTAGKLTKAADMRLIPAAFVSGVVRMADTNRPVVGATVRATGPGDHYGSSRYAITDRSGAYSLPVTPGHNTIYLGAEAFVSDSARRAPEVTLRAGETRSGVDFLLYTEHQYRGQVLLPDGTPAAGVRVFRSFAGIMNVPELEDEVLSDNRGRFVFPPMWESMGRDNRLDFSEIGILALEPTRDLAGVVFTGKEDQPLIIRLAPAAHLVADIVDTAGAHPVPAVGAQLVVYHGQGAAIFRTRTQSDAQGHLRMAVPSGVKVEAFVTGDAVPLLLETGWESDEYRMTLAPGQEMRLATLHMNSQGRSLPGSVVYPDGRPAAGVVVYPPGGWSVALAKPATTDAQGRFKLTGLAGWGKPQVVAFASQEPLAATQYYTTADAEGRFETPFVRWEWYRACAVWASDPERNLAGLAWVNEPGPVEIRLALGAYVTATAATADGKPAPAVWFTLTVRSPKGFPEVLVRGTTDAAGKLRMGPLSAGVPVGMSVWVSGHGPELAVNGDWDDPQSFTLTPGEERALPSFRYEPGGRTLRGTVLDEGGAPVPGAKVALIVPGSGPLPPVTADARGHFQLTKLIGRGALWLVAAHPTRPLVTVRQVDAVAEPEPRLTLRQTGTLTGRIFDAAGQPVAGGQVGFTTGLIDGLFQGPPDFLKAIGMSGRVRTDADGKFRLAGLPAGMEYRSTYFPPGQGVGWGFGAKTSLQPGQTVDLGEWVSLPDKPPAARSQAGLPAGAAGPPPAG